MSISSVLGIGAYTPDGDSKADIIRNVLQEKHNENFTVCRIGAGDTFPPSDYTKAYCHSERYPKKEFKVMLHKDGDVLDNYICVLLSERIEKVVNAELENHFNNFTAIVEIDNNWVFIKDKNTKDPLDSFIDKYPNMSVITTVFVNSIEKDIFSKDKLNDITFNLSTLIPKGNISVLFFKDFNKEDELRIYCQINSITEKFKHYENDDNCTKISRIVISSNNPPLAIENLKEEHLNVKDK